MKIKLGIVAIVISIISLWVLFSLLLVPTENCEAELVTEWEDFKFMFQSEWSFDGERIAVSWREDGETAAPRYLDWISLDGKRARLSDDGWIWIVGWDKDGEKLAYFRGGNQVWVWDGANESPFLIIPQTIPHFDRFPLLDPGWDYLYIFNWSTYIYKFHVRSQEIVETFECKYVFPAFITSQLIGFVAEDGIRIINTTTGDCKLLFNISDIEPSVGFAHAIFASISPDKENIAIGVAIGRGPRCYSIFDCYIGEVVFEVWMVDLEGKTKLIYSEPSVFPFPFFVPGMRNIWMGNNELLLFNYSENKFSFMVKNVRDLGEWEFYKNQTPIAIDFSVAPDGQKIALLATDGLYILNMEQCK